MWALGDNCLQMLIDRDEGSEMNGLDDYSCGLLMLFILKRWFSYLGIEACERSGYRELNMIC